jgi:hypothetical protein
MEDRLGWRGATNGCRLGDKRKLHWKLYEKPAKQILAALDLGSDVLTDRRMPLNQDAYGFSINVLTNFVLGSTRIN